MSNLLDEIAIPALAAGAGALAGSAGQAVKDGRAVSQLQDQANNLQNLQGKVLKGGGLLAGGLGLGYLGASRAKPIPEQDMQALRELQAQGKFTAYSTMGVANFFFDPSMLIDAGQHLMGSGGQFLQDNAQHLMMLGGGLLGAKARGKAATDVAKAAADTAQTIKKVGRNGLLAGGAGGIAAGAIGTKAIGDKLKERGAIQPLYPES